MKKRDSTLFGREQTDPLSLNASLFTPSRFPTHHVVLDELRVLDRTKVVDI